MVSQTYTQAQLDTFLAAKATPAQISVAITALVNGASTALDTLGEIDAQIAADEGSAAALAALVATKAGLLTPTATKTAAYVSVVGDLAMMNVPGGATSLTLPATPADKSLVGVRAIGATVAVPLVVNRGGSSDTIGTAGLTSATMLFADEVSVLQYDAPNGRWLGVANVKSQAALDARFEPVGLSNTSKQLLATYNSVPQAATTKSVSLITEPIGNTSNGFGSRIRPVQNRRSMRIINIGANPFRIGYSAQVDNTGQSLLGTYAYVVQPGQELFDTSGNSQAVYLSDVSSSGLALAALVIAETYL